MNEKQTSLAADVRNAIRGVCMGCADVVPGVSGGTVALILGIYERLVTAISHVDTTAFRHMRRRRWKELAAHIDLRFLVALGGGLLSGVVVMTLIIGVLLNNATTRGLTYAVFFGAIFASAILVARLIKTATVMQTVRCVLLGIIGAIFAYWVSTLQSSPGTASPSHVFVFFSGCVAICAMILPGISGAMILLVLGVYEHLTEIPRNFLAGKDIVDGVVTIAVFGAGCVISLVLFSKLLRWLLSRHHATTMSLLCGFMFGALRKLWPFQTDLNPEIEKFKEKAFAVYLPEQFDSQVFAVCVAAVLAAGFVFAVDYWTRRSSDK
ncbi:MAG: DUF368 domain-containing protein [Planctomycetaceae bacterium]|nr:DUF368 domain-containing protein [Planctomycetales bacterium]MCB9937140.1 DUF368 domain-containing protein [Planctomycetaceae bacterium]